MVYEWEDEEMQILLQMTFLEVIREMYVVKEWLITI